MTRTLISVSLGASLTIAAFAASASAQTRGEDAAGIVTRNAADLTCSDLIGMDDEGVGNLLHYVAGYAGRGSEDVQADGGAADAGASTAPAHPLGPTGSDNAAASGTTSENAARETGETEAASDTAAAPEGRPGATLASVGGFEIDVKQAVADCEAVPEARLIELIEQQRASK